MTTTDESFETLASVVLDEARIEREHILQSTEAQIEAQRKSVEEQCRLEREKILAHAYEEAKQICNQARAEAQLTVRKKQLAYREELLENVFDSAGQQLTDITRWDDYDQIARELLREALMHLDADVAVVYMDAKTRECLSDEALSDIGQDLNVTLHIGDVLDQEIGVVVETPDGHRRYDNTLARRLSRLQRPLRAKVHHLLIGEAQ